MVHRLPEFKGEECDLLFVTGPGSWRSRGTARRLYRLASLSLSSAGSTGRHPIPLRARRQRNPSMLRGAGPTLAMGPLWLPQGAASPSENQGRSMIRSVECRLLALLGPGAMSELSPQCAE